MDRLPWLTLEKILGYLDPASLSRVGACNSTLYDAVNSDRLWRRHVQERGWERFGPGADEELQARVDERDRDEEPSARVSSTCPRFLLDGVLMRESSNMILPECCQWHQVFLRGLHLDANWRLGRYSVWSRLAGHRGRTSRISDMCCDGRTAVTGASDGSVCVWRVQTPGNDGVGSDAPPVSLLRRVELEKSIVSLSLSPYHMAVAVSQGLVYISRPDATDRRRLHLAPPNVELSYLRLSPCCPVLAAVTEPAPAVSVYTWNLNADQPGPAFPDLHTDEATCAEVHGALLITGAWDGALAVIDLADGRIVAHQPAAHPPGLTCLRARDATLLTGGADGVLACWGLEELVEERWRVVAVEGDGEVYCVDAGPAGVVSGGSDSRLRLWSWLGEPQRVFEGHHGVVRQVTMRGQRLVSAGDVKMVFVWDVGSGKGQRLHRNSTLVGRMWGGETCLLIASPDAPAELSALSFW